MSDVMDRIQLVPNRRYYSIMGVKTNLPELRAKRGLGAAQLAQMIGVTRQTVYAIEAGNYVPNTAVSLKLARALETTVEEIFQLEPENRSTDQTAEVTVLGDTQLMTTGQPLRLCEVDERVVAVAPEIGGWGLPPAGRRIARADSEGKTPRHGDRPGTWR